MLLLFNTSENLEYANFVVLKLGVILFYSGIHLKHLKLSKRKKTKQKTKNKNKNKTKNNSRRWHLPEATPSVE